MKKLTDRKSLLTALAVLLVPLLVAGSFLWGTWNSNPRLRRVEAAVVNLDEMVTVNGQVMPIGRQLSAELVDTDREQNFTWVLADEKNARAGLASGRYAAVVTIPKDFSANATSFSKGADEAKQASIHVETSPLTGVQETALGQSIANAAADALNKFLTEEYLKNVYIGFNDMGKQFVELRDGTRQLADGASQLADGTHQTADGARQLSDGMVKLKAGGAELKSGAQQAAGGARQYVDGVGQLSSGIDKYAAGVGTFASGTHDLADGLNKYSDGADQLATGAKTYAGGIRQYVDGVNQLTTPLLSFVTQIEALIDSLPDFTGLRSTLMKLGQTLPGQLVEANTYIQDLVPRVIAALKALDDIGSDVSELNQGLVEADAWLEQLQNNPTTIACPERLKSVPGACEAFAEGVQQGAQQTAVKLPKLSEHSAEIEKTLAELKAQRAEIIAGLEQLTTISQKLADYAPQIEEMLTNIPADAPDSKADVVKQLATMKAGLTQLIDAGPKLASGGDELASGAGELASGAEQLAGGADKLAGGADQLSSGAGQLASGAKTLATRGSELTAGLDKLATGVGQYSDGVGQAADGTAKLADGAAQLADGADKLADGVDKLADGVAAGADQIPSFDETQRKNLANVVSEPVSTAGLDALVTPTTSWGSLLLVMALWLGGLATYVAVRAMNPRNYLSNASNGRLLWRVYAPGMGIVGTQALLLSALGAGIMGLSVPTAFGVAGVLLVAGAAFVAVNHALVAWMGNVGRLLSLFFLLITTVTAIAYSAPGIFDTLRPLSPLSPALDAVRSMMTGHSVALPLLTLVGWGLIGAIASGAAIVRSRTVRVATLMAA